MRIVVIDDDLALCRSLQLQLERQGHQVVCAHSVQEGLERIRTEEPALALVDLKLPDKPGLEILKALAQSDSATLAVMITSVQDTRATIDAIRMGAFDYIRKPLDIDAVLFTIEKVEQRLKNPPALRLADAVEAGQAPYEIVGAHAGIVDVLKQVALLSGNKIPVLVLGESGTGKELVARALHETGCAGERFVAVNCSAIVPALLESELFGHAKGAFTGADSAKTGKLKYAGNGTLFLDEIGDMSYELQAKLLRVLQEREFEPVGSIEASPFTARVIASTHRDLASMVAEGTFREDLYYRLAVSTIRLPALRERLSDLPLLTNHVLARINRELHKSLSNIEEAALRRLQTYDWPGNVRELINVLTRAALLCRDAVLTEEAVASALGPGTPPAPHPAEIKTLREVERDHIGKALLFTDWNIKQAAALLGTSRVTLRKKIGEFGLRH